MPTIQPESGQTSAGDEWTALVRPPELVIALPLEGTPRAVNARELSEGELRRIADWFCAHDDGRLPLKEWVELHVIARGIREAA
jgi:hypothetical protein